MGPGAIKIGLLHSRKVIEAVVQSFQGMPAIPIVVDPVLVSSSSSSLIKEDFISTFKELMIPISTLLTPNIPEAEALTGLEIYTLDDVEEVCRQLHIMGASNILLKGGHLEGEEAVDILFDGNDFHKYPGKRISGSFRGTGCSYSTLIACYLGRGLGIQNAIEEAKDRLQMSIEHAVRMGLEGPNTLFLGGSKGGGA